MPDADSLALAAALLASGAKSPRVLTTLSEVYANVDENFALLPGVVLSPQLAKFYRDLEEKHGMTAAAARCVARDVVAECRRGEAGPIRVEYVNDWRQDPAETRKENPE